MSTPYELTGRTRQKLRTRAAMIDAARELLASGLTLTVEQAADRAAVSRTTAYRYFANQRALLLAAYPVLDTASLLGPDAPDEAPARMALVVDRFTGMVIEHEAELRAMLRLSLESPAPHTDALPLRRGRAIKWIDEALAPLAGEISGDALRRLALAIRATTGIEALVWLCDVGQLSRQDAVEIMKWSAQSLLQSALAQADLLPQPNPRGTRKPQTSAKRRSR